MRSAFPIPSCEWVCCSRADEVAEALKAAGGETPLKWEHTQELVKNWKCGEPTPIYEKAGIYK